MRRLAAMVIVFTGLCAVGCASAPPQQPVSVVMSTEHGDIGIELDVERAPITTKNFLRYVDDGRYDNAVFYRSVRYDNDNGAPKIEVIQGGLGPGVERFDPIEHEDTDATGILHLDGVISMARAGVGTATSEFSIVIGDQPALDKGASRNADGQGFAAFGRVVSGMDVVRSIHALASNAPSETAYTAGQLIEEPVVIFSVRRVP